MKNLVAQELSMSNIDNIPEKFVTLRELGNWRKLNYRWEVRPMRVLELRTLLLADMGFLEALQPKANKNPVFYKDIKYSAKKNTQVFVSCYGQQGSGKSSAIQYVAEYTSEQYGYKFTEKDIYFKDNQMLEAFSKAERGQFFIRDEQTKRFGMGSSEEKQKVENIEQVVREKQLNFGWVAPDLRTHYHFSAIMTIAIDYNRQEALHLLFSGGDNPMVLGNITTKKPDEKIWQKYLVEKRKNYEELLAQKHYDEYPSIDILAKDIIQKAKLSSLERYSKIALHLIVMKYGKDMTTSMKDFVVERIKQLLGGEGDV